MAEPSQLDLFGGAAAGPPACAAVPEALRRLAGELPRRLRLGTSSWSFPGWQGLVYRHRMERSRLAREGLTAYAAHPLLRTVGVDSGFYAPLDPATLARCARAVPEDFRFLVKAARHCTSPWLPGNRGRPAPNPHWLDPEFAQQHVVEPFRRGLGGRAGVLLFQFPPQGTAVTRRPEAFADRLHAFLRALPTDVSHAVELRDAVLLGPAYAEALAEAGASHSVVVHPRMPPPQAQAVFAGGCTPLVVRWMLHGGLGYEEARARYRPFDALVDPDPHTRVELARLIVDALAQGRTAWVIANNKAEGCAPLTLVELARRIAGAGDGDGDGDGD